MVMASKSVVKFTPKTEMDFGSLVCWASNQVGLGSPCVYHLLPIGPPDPPTDCYTHNITYSTVQVGTGGAPLCIIYGVKLAVRGIIDHIFICRFLALCDRTRRCPRCWGS